MPPQANTVLTIPLTTLPVGLTTLGPASISNSFTAATLLINRNVTNGLNSQSTAETLTISVYQSNDGGVTFVQLVSAMTSGGTVVRRGSTVNTSDVTIFFPPGVNRQLQATANVVGSSSLAVSGSLTVQ